MKSQSPVETLQVHRCKAPPATLAQTKSQSLAAAAEHCTGVPPPSPVAIQVQRPPATLALYCTK